MARGMHAMRAIVKMPPTLYRGVQNYSCLFENSRPCAAGKLGQPTHSQSANCRKFKLNSHNLAGIIVHHSVQSLQNQILNEGWMDGQTAKPLQGWLIEFRGRGNKITSRLSSSSSSGHQ